MRRLRLQRLGVTGLAGSWGLGHPILPILPSRPSVCPSDAETAAATILARARVCIHPPSLAQHCPTPVGMHACWGHRWLMTLPRSLSPIPSHIIREPPCKAMPSRAARGEVYDPDIEFAFLSGLEPRDCRTAAMWSGFTLWIGVTYLAARRQKGESTRSRGLQAAGKRESPGQLSPLDRIFADVHDVQPFPPGEGSNPDCTLGTS